MEESSVTGAELAARARGFLGCPVLDGLGSTEMLHIFLSNRSGFWNLWGHRFDPGAGKAVGAGRAALQEIRPRPGYSEQRAEGWWEATATAVVDLLQNLGVAR